MEAVLRQLFGSPRPANATAVVKQHLVANRGPRHSKLFGMGDSDRRRSILESSTSETGRTDARGGAILTEEAWCARLRGTTLEL